MKKLIVLLVAVMLLTVSSFAAQTVVDQPVTIRLLAGELEISTDSAFEFADVNLTTIDWVTQATQTPTEIPGYNIKDERGNGAGWNVTFVCNRLQQTDPANGKTQMLEFELSAGLAGMTMVNGQALDEVNGPKVIAHTYGNMEAADEVITAAAGYGMGEYDFDFLGVDDVRIVLASSNAFAGLYTGTFTATVISGPAP